MAMITRLPYHRLRHTSMNAVWERRGRVLEALAPRLERPSLAVPVPGIQRRVMVEIASTRATLDDAFRLVQENYEAHGYEPPNSGTYRFTRYHALPTTMVLVAREHGRVLATLSLIMDNPLLGLPSDSIYGSEVDELRCRGRRLCEVGNLADRELSHREFLPVFVALNRLAWQYAIHHGRDTALITSTPRHGLFYRKVMGFVPLGPSRPYPYVQDTLAQAYWLDVPRMKAAVPEMHRQVFGTPLPRTTLVSRQISPELVRYFGSRSSRTSRQDIEKILDEVERGRGFRAVRCLGA